MAEDPDELIPCPYDPVHMVARKRMPYHIMKCRKNFGQRDFATCPFNARHIVPKREFDDHLKRCTDRHLAEVDMMKEQEDLEREREGTILKGNTSVPTSNFVPESTESWDDENYVVEIAPREGLFSSNAHNRRREEPRPQIPRATVSNPPELRMPRGTQGTGSEVYNYSVQQSRQEQQGLPPQQAQSQPRVPSMGRGRGRGRGRGTSVAQVGGNPPPGRPKIGRGAGALKVQQQPPPPELVPPPGFAPVPAQGQSLATAATVPQLSQEDLVKRERKLRKMLRQIETLEEKQERGEPLDPDQEAKLLRKNDVIVQLEQVEAKKAAAAQ